MKMKKRDGVRKKPNFNVMFIVIVIIILAVAVYLAFISPVIQFSPGDNSLQIARAVIGAMGSQRLSTGQVCNFLLRGNPSEIRDERGNVYTYREDAPLLVEALGGRSVIRSACRTTVTGTASPQPATKSTSSGTPIPAATNSPVSKSSS